MDHPLVSVVVPAFNADKFIGAALESVLAQTYSELEIIVVDDGSTDHTADIVRSFLPDLRLIRKRQSGPAAARNTALRTATGKYCAFLDADDLWHPEKCELQVRLLERRQEIRICSGSMCSFDDGHTPPPLKPSREYTRISGEELLLRNHMRSSSVMVRESARRGMLFDETIQGGEDWDLWRRILRGGDALRISGPIGWYRKRPGSLSTNALKMLNENRKVLSKTFAENPTLPMHLKLQALSYLHFDAAIEYRHYSFWQSFVHWMESCMIWPFSFPERCLPRFRRARFGAVLVARAMANSLKHDHQHTSA